ncbi:unnamed protein product [Brachionus calyciflorus]|uniref:Endonuclease/exonuclease/phosphatase domain-containing protein n=1 Tax=Brachionus calyciflorus TaxID=104777 RepID=A0A813QZV7_9BILA|nr:unnamed protein product [Brachionus calyciflorus]
MNKESNEKYYEDDEDVVEQDQPQTSKNASRNDYFQDRSDFKQLRYQKQYRTNDSWSSKKIITTRYEREIEATKKPSRPRRHWQLTPLGEQIQKIKFTPDSKFYDSFQFKIASYNLLAQDLLEDNFYLYENLNKKYLSWDYRKHNILEEIKKLNAHIYCFQEMQASDYENFFRKKLNNMGLESVYKKRYGDKPDGCCIAFRKVSFEIVKHVDVDYFVPGVEILNRENVGIIMLLKHKAKKSDDKPKFLCVATTHILYNPKRGDCKLAQLQVLLANLDRVAYKNSKIQENKLVAEYHATLLCGDFNLSNQSDLYNFMRTSKLEDYKNLSRNNLSGQKMDNSSFVPIGCTILPERLGISDQCQFKQEVDSRYIQTLLNKSADHNIHIDCTFGCNTLTHCFKFKSTYEHYDNDGIPEITTCVLDCHKSVDFIFYHSDNLESKGEECEDFVDNLTNLNQLARLELFNENFCKDLYLPNKFYSSDHFMIAGKFLLT